MHVEAGGARPPIVIANAENSALQAATTPDADADTCGGGASFSLEMERQSCKYEVRV